MSNANRGDEAFNESAATSFGAIFGPIGGNDRGAGEAGVILRGGVEFVECGAVLVRVIRTAEARETPVLDFDEKFGYTLEVRPGFMICEREVARALELARAALGGL